MGTSAEHLALAHTVSNFRTSPLEAVSFQSRVVLLVWILIGVMFYFIIRKNYAKGKN